MGRPIDSLADEDDEALTGALLAASAIDDLRALRIEFQQFLKALSKR